MDEQLIQNAGQQVNAVVDKLAEKLGVAADRIAPIAEQMGREVVAEAWVNVYVYTAVGASILLFTWALALVVILSTRKCASAVDRTMSLLVSIIVGFLVTIATLCITSEAILGAVHRAVAPTVYLVEKFLR